jgi:hypothetical protein
MSTIHLNAGDRQTNKLPQLPSAWRIVRPDDEPDAPNSTGQRGIQEQPRPKRRRKSLREVWTRYLQPRLIEEGRKPATFRAYQTHLNAWEKYWRERAQQREARQGFKKPLNSNHEPSNHRPDALSAY